MSKGVCEKDIVGAKFQQVKAVGHEFVLHSGMSEDTRTPEGFLLQWFLT